VIHSYQRLQSIGMSRTREFHFPNGGHSVRKLVQSLEELGTQLVMVKTEISQYGPSEWTMWFSTGEYAQVRADLLAKKLLTLGTRFQCSKGGDLTFTTKWSDLQTYPEAYGLA
jgi:hypothetical protein